LRCYGLVDNSLLQIAAVHRTRCRKKDTSFLSLCRVVRTRYNAALFFRIPIGR
jgi:hypothetical protein